MTLDHFWISKHARLNIEKTTISLSGVEGVAGGRSWWKYRWYVCLGGSIVGETCLHKWAIIAVRLN